MVINISFVKPIAPLLKHLVNIGTASNITMANTHNVTCTFDGNTSIKGEKLIYPAASRNKEPILQALKDILLQDGNTNDGKIFLEVASGSGQHLAHFAPHFPQMCFQPTEVDDSLLGSINIYANNCQTKNIKKPIQLDICKDFASYGFEESSIDYIYNANMIHISPFQCTIGLFKNAGKYLKPSGLMITYGPYAKDGVISPESNVSFNESLKARDPCWGIRDINDLCQLGNKNNLLLKQTLDMPANNKILVWKKTCQAH